MFRRGHKGFLIILCVFCLSFILRPYSVFTEEKIQQFLNLPFERNIKLLQGWYYNVLVNGSKNHGAIDYDCELGNPVYAAFDGLAMTSIQLDARTKRGYGNFVLIKHENGYATLYGHLEKINEKIKAYPEGQRSNISYSEWTSVKKGEYIGDCGTSGTDNVHLHFEVTTGKYAVGRVDSYDLYKTKEFYPPNASYTAMGQQHLWATTPPSFLETIVATDSDTGENKKGVWDTIKGIFTNTEEVSAVKGEQDSDNQVIGISFIDKKINLSSKPGVDTKIVIRVKNIGTKIWKRNEISLNVIGGVTANNIFRHSSWITDLRPTLLDNAEVKPGESGTFTFSIKALAPGSYVLKLMAVETETWKQIGTEQSAIHISVDELVEEKKIFPEPLSEPPKPLEGVVRGIKDFADSVIDKVTDVIKSIPNLFGGGSGASTTNEEKDSHTESSTEAPIASEEPDSVEPADETEVLTEETKSIIVNEVAWFGVSSACADHEWIEFYNPTNSLQSLEGWQLDLDTNGLVQTVLLKGIIERGSYYLISHPNTFVSIVTPDMLLPLNIHLADTGARIVLKNESGVVVDEIDQNQGWLGGVAGQYPYTLERMSSSSWKSSDSVRYGVSSGLCGQMAGSPRMANNGYAYISDDTVGFYNRNSDGEIILSKEENPYLFSNLTIHEGEQMVVKEGIIFAGVNSEAQINVQGKLAIEGTENDPVVFTSRNDGTRVSSSVVWANVFTTQLPQAGDWQNIVIGSTGKLTINHALLTYGGNRYGTSVSCQGCARSQVISNEGGNVVLSNMEISNGYALGTSGKPDSLIYSDDGSLTLENVQLHHGKRAIHSEGNTGVSANSVIIHDFDVLDKVIYFQEKLPSLWENIVFTGNSPNFAYSPALIVTSSYTITKGNQFQFTNVTINSGATFTINGGNLYATEIKNNGNLNISGGETGSEIAGGPSPSSTFSLISFTPGSTGSLSNVRIRGGGYTSAFPFTSTRPYMLWIDGASVTISNSQLIDSRRTGGIVVVKNGNLDIRDSELGWYANYNKLDSWRDYGIVGNNQSTIHLENVNFRKMDYVVELNQGSTTTYSRMTKDNFIDLYKPDLNQKNWFPQNLFPFKLW